MRSVVYRETGGPEVLEVVDRPEPEPGEGEVLVRVAVSGVNPTDCDGTAQEMVAIPEDHAAEAIGRLAPDGVDLVVEVAPDANADLDRAVLGADGTVAVYASGDDLCVPVRWAMRINARYQFVLVYTVPARAKRQAVQDVSAAVAAGVLRVGAEAGLPLHRFPLEHTADAHSAVENGAVGKVLVDVG